MKIKIKFLWSNMETNIGLKYINCITLLNLFKTVINVYIWQVLTFVYTI